MIRFVSHLSYKLLAGLLSVGLSFCSFRAQALPIERFNSELVLGCGEGQRECAGVLRVDEALGRHTGIAVLKSDEGVVSVKITRDKGIFQLKADGVTDLTLTFSWDGDSNPDVLSGSGLNCVDLTKGNAHALVVSNVSAESECDQDAVAATCPQFTVESRVYDAQDPTGQRFSSSVVSRGNSVESNLFIPFSNFTRRGPRGKGNFTCVGAVTISFKFSGLRDLDLTLGEIATNGQETKIESVPRNAVTPILQETKSAVITENDQGKVRADKLAVVPATTGSSVDAHKQREAVASSVVAQPSIATKPRKRALEESVFGSLVAE
jgi:hypothetical protein